MLDSIQKINLLQIEEGKYLRLSCFAGHHNRCNGFKTVYENKNCECQCHDKKKLL